mmetsp:Transcript_42850/g.83984  ORF Transcript_42850/g.83984 Transcript_42850/m.83984 type:complete len:346 (+) Transcript_42850:66-1103(+)
MSAIQASFAAFAHEASSFCDIMQRFEELKKQVGCDRFNKPACCYRALRDSTSSNYAASSWWMRLDERRGQEIYRGLPCQKMVVVVVGAGPVGLRTAIEAALLGAKVTVVEKRKDFSRFNILHLWDQTVADLKGLGMKFFNPKFGLGSVYHVPIRDLQNTLLKVCLVLGVEFVTGWEFEGFEEPPAAETKISDHDCNQTTTKYQIRIGNNVFSEDEKNGLTRTTRKIPCDVLIGADGENSLVSKHAEFERQLFRAGTAIGVTANFRNLGSKQENRLKEFTGSSVYKARFFQKIREQHNFELENLVYYRGPQTHYLVMTPKKSSLLVKNILKTQQPTIEKIVAAFER